MDDLVAWLRGVLDDDERTARYLRSALPDVPSERRFSYDFLLADIEAKRAILDLADRYIEAGRFQRLSAVGEHYAKVVRLLASAYRDRPGYRDEWRP